jgi:hypothetical protein
MVHARPLSALCGSIALCLFAVPHAGASTFATSNVFAADNSTYELTFSETTLTNFTAATSSFATGGFLPVLTLFNGTTGAEIDNDGSGPEAGLRDASLTDILGPGVYDLFLTEFPNVAVGNLADGFLFAGDPTATGDVCGVTGGMFLNTITCTPTSNQYALTVTTTAATATTPEPPSALLLFLPLAGIVALNRRRFAAAF